MAMLATLGCGSSSGSSAAGAAVLGSLAAASAVASRAAGGCYAQCAYGTVCNTATGLCERLPCGGQCLEGQVCDPVTDTCKAPPSSTPVDVMRMVGAGMWWWPFSPYFTYANPYYVGPGYDPRGWSGLTPTRPPPVEPVPSQGALPPGQ